MAEYIAVYQPGLEPLAQDLPKLLKGAKPLQLQSGFVLFSYGGPWQSAARVPLFHNCFLVIRRFRGEDFSRMVRAVVNGKNSYLPSHGTFRVRFSVENRFEKAPADMLRAAETEVARATRMGVDRVNPDNEIWYLLREDGGGYYAQLLPAKKEAPLNKGELRPELAWAMCRLARITPGQTVCDPFAGHGAIPAQAVRAFRPGHVFAYDKNEGLALALSRRFQSQRGLVTAGRADVFSLNLPGGAAADHIITDPPWGRHEQVDDISQFYSRMLEAFARICSENATAVVLSGAKQELATAAQQAGIRIVNRLDTLVNGQKAALFVMKLNESGNNPSR